MGHETHGMFQLGVVDARWQDISKEAGVAGKVIEINFMDTTSLLFQF